MLEYFTYKKVKKHREEKAEKAKSPAATPSSPSTSTPKVISKPEDKRLGTPLLNPEDERFLEHITSPTSSTFPDDEGPPPPLPPRVLTPALSIRSDAESFDSQDPDRTRDHVKSKDDKTKGKGKEVTTKDDAKPIKQRFNVITTLGRTISQRVGGNRKSTDNSGLKPAQLTAVTERETRQEETDITKLLDDLDMSAQNNKVFSLSADSAEMVRKFNLILKDLVNGVPTAYGDLVSLLEDRDGVLARNYEKLPSSLKKLVVTLPNKLTTTLAPELAAVAAAAQGVEGKNADKAGLKGAAKSFLTPKSLQDLVTKPGAVVGLLKGIVNALKTRWPAFMGTNVLWSVAIFLLLSALWYCHKRGRETRLEREAAEKGDPLLGVDRVEELPDDPQLPAPSSAAHSSPSREGRRSGRNSPARETASASKKR